MRSDDIAHFFETASDRRRFPYVYAMPWALIRRNGGTQLAFITKVNALPHGELEFRGKIWSATSRSWTKGDCTIREVLHTWRNCPTWQSVKRQKAIAKRRSAARLAA